MAKKAVSTAQVIVNNTAYPIVPNTLTYTEGFGEYTLRSASAGSGRSEVVFAENAEQKMSKISFEMFPTAENIATIRSWKAALDNNLIEISTSEFNRTFTNATLTNDYEINIGADTTIAVEWMSDPAA